MNGLAPRAIVGCECSGAIRRELRLRGWDAWSCDLKPAEDGDPHHIQGDVLTHLNDGWDLGIFHPVCTRLANSGVRWLSSPPSGRTIFDMWRELADGAEFYCTLRDAPIKYRAIENPIMHEHARRIIKPGPRQVVQPWWFGDPYFKGTGFELFNLPHLRPTNKLSPPLPGTKEHANWSAVHRAKAGPQRQTERSRTYRGIAAAIAEQWGGYVWGQLKGETNGLLKSPGVVHAPSQTASVEGVHLAPRAGDGDAVSERVRGAAAVAEGGDAR
jgi:hypothetical protein